MGAIDTKTFKSGNSVAVRLPKAIAFPPDTAVTIERRGDVVTIRPVEAATEGKQRLLDMLERMQRIGAPPDGVQEREPFEFPDRPGL